MRRPDPTAPAKRPRDPRIDAFRGLALVMIFVDHVPGNPYEHFTLRNFGFSDAAESFFVMSGIAAGLAYSGRFLPGALARDGLWAAVRPVWGRAWTLYLSQLFLTAWAIAIFAWGASTFDLPGLLTKINLRQVFENTGAALVGIPALTHQLGYVNILPAYSVLLVCTPLALVIGLRRPLALAALAAGLWFAAGLWRLNLPNYPNPGGWFFNPLAWQAVFVTGLLIGLRLREGARLVPVSRRLFWLAAGYLVLVIAWMKIDPLGHWLNHQLSLLGKAGAPFHLISHDKTFLALPRLLHVLALVYVISCLPAVTAAAASPLAAPLRLMGRQGLLVFCTGTLISLAFQVAMAARPGDTWLAWGLPPLGIAGMLAAAALGEAARARHRPSAGMATPHGIAAE
ncbi:MAG: OpgC family protein [Rhodovulum sp.]